MKQPLSIVDLLWGVLCLPIYRHVPFPMRLLVDFFWERRGDLCGAAHRFGENRWRVELALTQSLAFGEISGVLIADLDPGEHMVRLAPGPLSQRKQRLEAEGVYDTYGDELKRLASEFNGCIVAWYDGEQAVTRRAKRSPPDPIDCSTSSE